MFYYEGVHRQNLQKIFPGKRSRAEQGRILQTKCDTVHEIWCIGACCLCSSEGGSYRHRSECYGKQQRKRKTAADLLCGYCGKEDRIDL